VRTLVTLACWLAPTLASADVRPGDVVFQRSRTAQAEVIAEVTRSEWTHVGVVLERDGALVVLEAGAPVGWTPIADWKARGVGGRMLVRRLPRRLGRAELARLARLGERFVGRAYDARFEWNDRRLYCSELVYRLFELAVGVRLVEPQRWRDLVFTARARALARRRLGRQPEPNGRVVTPAALATAPTLRSVAVTPRPVRR